MQIIKLQVALYKSTLFCLICVVGNLCGLEFNVTHISFIILGLVIGRRLEVLVCKLHGAYILV
jgi:hypothetical protein